MTWGRALSPSPRCSVSHSPDVRGLRGGLAIQQPVLEADDTLDRLHEGAGDMDVAFVDHRSSQSDVSLEDRDADPVERFDIAASNEELLDLLSQVFVRAHEHADQVVPRNDPDQAAGIDHRKALHASI